MKNKKAGILTPEILKIMLALIVIFFLILLSYNIYSAITKKTEKEQARATLNAIIGKIETLDKGEKTSYIVTAPKGWSLVFYGKGENKPKECKDGDYCLCMCEGKISGKGVYSQEKWYWIIPKCKSLICKTTEKEISLGTVFEEIPDGLKEHEIKTIIFLEPPFPVFFQESLGTIYLTSSDKIPLEIPSYIETFPFEGRVYRLSPSLENFLSQKVSFSSKDTSFDGTMYDFLKLIIKDENLQNNDIIKLIDKSIEEYSKEIEKKGREVNFLLRFHSKSNKFSPQLSYKSAKEITGNLIEEESDYRKFLFDDGWGIEIGIWVYKNED